METIKAADGAVIGTIRRIGKDTWVVCAVGTDWDVYCDSYDSGIHWLKRKHLSRQMSK